MLPGRYRIGVDIGGMFTDLIALDTISVNQMVGKVLTTPADSLKAVVLEFNGSSEHLVRWTSHCAFDWPATRTLRAQ